MQTKTTSLDLIVTETMEARKDTAFMRFWRVVNAILAARGEPEMMFGEARSFWAEFTQSGF